MAVTPSPLLPLFRSDTQLAILTALFCGPDDELMISELSDHLQIPISSVAREVHRLEDAEIVRVRKRGRAQFVSPNRSLPWAGPLTELLDRTTGPAAAIAAAFNAVEGVEAVWIFGSWAARHRGIAGPAPHDIDVVVVGDPGALAVSRAAQQAELRTHVPVHPITVGRRDWDSPESESFLETIKNGPLVPVIARERIDVRT